MDWKVRLLAALLMIQLIAWTPSKLRAEESQPPATAPEEAPDNSAPEESTDKAAPSEPTDEPDEDEKPNSKAAKPEPPTPQPPKPDASDKPANDPPTEKQQSDRPADKQQPSEGEKSKAKQPSGSEEPSADEEKATNKEDSQPAEGEAKPEKSKQPTVQWNDEVEAVLEKRSPENVDDLKVIQQQTQRVVKHATPAVVSVRVGQAFGSAVIVSPEGLVLTAGHVVGKPGQPVTFIFSDGSTARGKTLGMYREIDSGMMQITDPGPWPYVEMGESDGLDNGEWVVVISHPGGFDRERTPPVRLGRVLFANKQVISTDCTLVGGDSGGPLFNMRGEVVGINSRIGRRITENFHVPISSYQNTWDRLVAGESWGNALGGQAEAAARPLLGVAGNSNSPDCKLTQVFPGMPAALAGLKPGDVVRTFNGKKVRTFDQLIELVYGRRGGDTVKLEVERGEETISVELRLALRKPLPGSAELPNKPGDKERE